MAVGRTFDPSDSSNFDPETFTPCWYASSALTNGELKEIQCDRPAVGRYVSLYLYNEPDQLVALSICEFYVYGE